ncbi:MAG: gamma-glutamyl-gamma-aminobutyrate hydrolase family protein, partial [Actinomycetota bacterium]|nr:gamma-glutamyl-gamma-aminobutyrate hydrolase family protein [Actinomycetota bacterium]
MSRLARRPVVGITAALESASWVIWRDTEVNISQRSYSECVTDAGALPVLLPADERSAAEPGELLNVLDGLVLAGGADLDPVSYGAEPHPKTAGYNAARDRFELALCRGAIERDLPVLGICRGAQILNVACGGDLVQHLGDSTQHVEVPGTFSTHEVRLAPGSLAARAADAERAEVRSHHHQALDRLGEGLVASGWSVPDELVEAVEMPERSFVVGFLWHPEELRDGAPFRALSGAASR